MNCEAGMARRGDGARWPGLAALVLMCFVGLGWQGLGVRPQARAAADLAGRSCQPADAKAGVVAFELDPVAEHRPVTRHIVRARRVESQDDSRPARGSSVAGDVGAAGEFRFPNRDSVDGRPEREAAGQEWASRILAGGDATAASGGPASMGTVVYSNTGGTAQLSLPFANCMIADDLRTLAPCGCHLGGFEFLLDGGGDGTGPGFIVNYALYDNCPGNGGQIIAGTEGAAGVADDGLHLITVDTTGKALLVPRSVWLALSFSRANVGWVTGTTAEVGLTFDFYHLCLNPCTASFQGSGLHAGFWAKLYCEENGGPFPEDEAVGVPLDVDLSWHDYGLVATQAPGGPAAEPPQEDDDSSWAESVPTGQWCGTQERYEARLAAAGSAASTAGFCPYMGICDDPELRDALIPGADTPLNTYRMFIHVFCEDDGTNCADRDQPLWVDGTMETVNEDFLPYRIQFEYEVAYHNNTDFLEWDESDENVMKTTYAVSPAEYLNVYLVVVQGQYSFGTFPWDSVALGPLGGIVMNKWQFGPGDSTLTHEAGHNLGLWHTHNGVSETPLCTDCWEEAQSNSSLTGDRCGDTDPTPVNWFCGPPDESDPCSGLPWGPTDFHNYMGYAGSPCWSEFSSQQAGRMHCWTEDRLTGWLATHCGALYDVYFGTVNPPTTLLCDDVEVPVCDPGVLDAETTYHWYIAATNDVGTTQSPVWTFTTGPLDQDCNNNGVPDFTDVLFGSSLDCNDNGLPDECDTIAGGDFNADGQVSLADLAALTDCFAGPGGIPLHPVPACTAACLAAFDDDGDNDLDLVDFAAFLQAVTGP